MSFNTTHICLNYYLEELEHDDELDTEHEELEEELEEHDEDCDELDELEPEMKGKEF